MNFDDAIALKTHLVSVIQSYLGEWQDGSPRIHIVPPSSKLQGRDKATATTNSEVECIISRLPTGQVSPSSSQQNLSEQSFRVELVNYADDTNLIKAVQAIEADSQIVFNRPTVYQQATNQVFEQAQLFIYSPKMINRMEVS